MAAKRIQISIDGGTTWRTLPGNSGDLREEMSTYKDTVFGQNWDSEDTSIHKWMVTANSIFKGIAGYQATIKKPGTSTAMTSEACSLVSGKTYQVTSAAKRILDYEVAITVFDNGVDHTADIISIDYLSGQVTFAASYTVTGPVTIGAANYLPMVTLAKGRGFTLTQTAAEIDTTDYETAQANNGYATFIQGLRTAGLEVSGVYDTTASFRTTMASRDLLVIEISPPGDGSTVFRGFFKSKQRGQSGNVGALEAQTLSFGLYVPDGALVVTPFSWYYSSSQLNQAVKDVLATWLGGTIAKVRYQPDNAIAGSGVYGDCIVTECSITNTLEGSNEYKFSFRGSGALTDV